MTAEFMMVPVTVTRIHIWTEGESDESGTESESLLERREDRQRKMPAGEEMVDVSSKYIWRTVCEERLQHDSIA